MTPKCWRASSIASALGLPVAQLFTDETVFELCLSDETKAEIRAGGPAANHAVAQRLATSLEPLIYAAATTPAPDTKPGARPKRPRTRVEKLRGVEQATAMREAAMARRKAERLEAEDGS